MGYYNSIRINDDSLDAASALSVSEKIITGSYVIQHDDLPLFFDRKGTGTQTLNINEGGVLMSVNAGQYTIAETKQHHPYMAGKPINVELTCYNFHLETNVIKRIGYFCSGSIAPYTTNYDGIYIESDGSGSTYNLVMMKNGVIIKKVPRAEWDDKLDGNGISGFNINFQNFNLFKFDFLYLGGTGVRFFIKNGNKTIVFHSYFHSNTIPSTIMLTPQQPIRYEIRSIGNGVGSLMQICSTVSIGGAINLIGVHSSVNTFTNFINASTIGTEYFVTGIRLKQNSRSSCVFLKSISIFCNTNDSFLWKLSINPTISGIITWSGITSTRIEKGIAAAGIPTPNVITPNTGHLISSGYSGPVSNLREEFDDVIRIGSTLDDVPDILILSVIPLTSNGGILGAINFLEIG